MAARRALDNAGVRAEDLDMILVSTSTPDGPFPSVACRVQDQLGVPGAVAWDLLAACTGFVYALGTAEAYISSGRRGAAPGQPGRRVPQLVPGLRRARLRPDHDRRRRERRLRGAPGQSHDRHERPRRLQVRGRHLHPAGLRLC
ncbi:MAG: hypothetical protein E6I08_14260 [Chloroflexi bacterium]|nr:MAG: hypothetical protein E6I08_14260 [Chloroflexota bacterium]